jgi:tetratricopeptide (TPR) repeat protein
MGETLVMLGDVAGVYGDLPVAVERYQRTPGYELNIEQYNYAMFRCGEMLDEMKRHDDVIAHFQAYIQRNREDSNIPLALYWVGSAMWKKEQQAQALAYWRDAIVKFGPDRKALGLDILMDEWVARARDAKPETSKPAWKGMHELLAEAEAKKQMPLVLRLRRLLSYEPDALEAEQRSLRRMVVQEANIPHASASVLEFILDQAEAATNHPLALKAAQALVAEFPETDAALAARMLLAKEARGAGNFDEAIKHLDIIREVFATSGEAGEALLMLGDLYLERKDWAKADEMYTQVLGVKEWKPLWPPALYGRGEVARGQKQFDKAAAFYERIYVLYAGHARWVPKAYVARAECLRRLGEIKNARETLEEMLKVPEIDQAPETPEAKAMLEDLKQRV